MKHIKTYKLFESYDSIQAKVEMCFVGVTDMDITVKYDGYTLWSVTGTTKEFITLKIGLDNRVTSGEEATSKWSVKYRPIIKGDEISFEISNAIQHCLGSDLDIVWAQVRWKNAGEWNQSGKSGMGPGLLEKTFSKTGVTKQFENPSNGNYNLDDLCDFIESKGDMLRTIEIHFTE
jgi:hypothetical protein